MRLYKFRGGMEAGQGCSTYNQVPGELNLDKVVYAERGEWRSDWNDYTTRVCFDSGLVLELRLERFEEFVRAWQGKPKAGAGFVDRK